MENEKKWRVADLSDALHSLNLALHTPDPPNMSLTQENPVQHIRVSTMFVMLIGAQRFIWIKIFHIKRLHDIAKHSEFLLLLFDANWSTTLHLDELLYISKYARQSERSYLWYEKNAFDSCVRACDEPVGQISEASLVNYFCVWA